MKLILYISLILSLSAQTDLVLDSSVRLQVNQVITVNSINGNGHTIYMRCGSVLKVKNAFYNVKIVREIYVDDNCNTEPIVTFEIPSKIFNVDIDNCIKVRKIVKIIKTKPLTIRQ